MSVYVYNVVGGVAFIYWEDDSNEKPTSAGMVHDDEVWALKSRLNPKSASLGQWEDEDDLES